MPSFWPHRRTGDCSVDAAALVVFICHNPMVILFPCCLYYLVSVDVGFSRCRVSFHSKLSPTAIGNFCRQKELCVHFEVFLAELDSAQAWLSSRWVVVYRKQEEKHGERESTEGPWPPVSSEFVLLDGCLHFRFLSAVLSFCSLVRSTDSHSWSLLGSITS